MPGEHAPKTFSYAYNQDQSLNRLAPLDLALRDKGLGSDASSLASSCVCIPVPPNNTHAITATFHSLACLSASGEGSFLRRCAEQIQHTFRLSADRMHKRQVLLGAGQARSKKSHAARIDAKSCAPLSSLGSPKPPTCTPLTYSPMRWSKRHVAALRLAAMRLGSDETGPRVRHDGIHPFSILVSLSGLFLSTSTAVTPSASNIACATACKMDGDSNAIETLCRRHCRIGMNRSKMARG